MTAHIVSSMRKHFLNTSPLSSVLKQIASARIDLRLYQPDSTNWEARAIATARVVVPWLEEYARDLQDYVAGVLNAPVELRRLWQDIQPIQQIPIETRIANDQQLEWDNVLRDTVSGDLVSKVVTKYLMDQKTGSRPELCRLRCCTPQTCSGFITRRDKCTSRISVSWWSRLITENLAGNAKVTRVRRLQARNTVILQVLLQQSITAATKAGAAAE